MFKNHIKIAFRSLWRNKAFSVINLSGLAIAMASVILIGVWVQNEWSFDRFHTNDKDLYKVWNLYTSPSTTIAGDITSGPIGESIKKDFPEVVNAARVHWSSDRLFSFGDKSIKTKGNEVDASFLSMFSFPLLQGDAEQALADVSSIVITESLAKTLFGDADPINKILKVDTEDTYTVTGVLKDLPSNTTFDFDYLLSLKANEKFYSNDGSWANNTFYTYVQLQPNTPIESFNEKIKNTVRKYSSYNWDIFLYPMSKMHLYSSFENGKPAGGRIDTLRLMTIIGSLILLIACINFMNLSTAQSQKRSKEVGVRKAIGANKSSLVIQFLWESFLLVFIAGALALVITAICLPFFNQILESSLVIDYSKPLLWIGLLVFVAFTGLLAGSYPAFFLSSFNPVKVLKGTFKIKNSFFDLRKVLVVTQFSIGIVLVVASIIVYQQISYVQNRDLGYTINDLVEVPIEGNIDKNFNLIKNDLLNNRAISSMSKTGWSVTLNASNSSGYEWDGMNREEEPLNFSIYRTQGDFAKTMKLSLSEGRDIDLALFPSDSSSVMLNKAALKSMQIENPIGKWVRSGSGKMLTIVGVFEDFIIDSPYEEVRPMLVLGSSNWNYNALLRLNEGNTIAANLKSIESTFKKYNPEYPFTYQFVDKRYERKFKEEKQTATLSTLFSGLAIFISCLGLFGLTAYTAEQRKKEIGVRKVLGASIPGIVRLLSTDFIRLVCLAILISTPIAWYLMEHWLQDFTYRVGVELWVFFIAGIAAIGIALFTVSFHAIKAAKANPIKSLRTE